MLEPDPSPPVRVALLSPCFWPEVRGESERFVRDLADGLLARGHHPTLITSHRGSLKRTVEDGFPVVRLPRPAQGRLLRRRYPPYLTHAPLSYLALRAGSYDIAHAVYEVDALAASRWARITGRPAVLSYMGIPDRRSLVRHRRQLDIFMRAVEGCDAVVVPSVDAAEAFRYWVGREARVIPPGSYASETPSRSRARAEESSLERCVENYLELYGELLGAPPRQLESARNAALVR